MRFGGVESSLSEAVEEQRDLCNVIEKEEWGLVSFRQRRLA